MKASEEITKEKDTGTKNCFNERALGNTCGQRGLYFAVVVYVFKNISFLQVVLA